MLEINNFGFIKSAKVEYTKDEYLEIEAAADLRADCVELHTGAYANSLGEARDHELRRLATAASRALELGFVVNAGHGLNYKNIPPILSLPGLNELNIGHSIVSRAVNVGMESAVREMLALIQGECL